MPAARSPQPVEPLRQHRIRLRFDFSDGLPAFGQRVTLALRLGLEQVGDEVVVVGAEHLRQHPARRFQSPPAAQAASISRCSRMFSRNAVRWSA